MSESCSAFLEHLTLLMLPSWNLFLLWLLGHGSCLVSLYSLWLSFLSLLHDLSLFFQFLNEVSQNPIPALLKPPKWLHAFSSGNLIHFFGLMPLIGGPWTDTISSDLHSIPPDCQAGNWISSFHGNLKLKIFQVTLRIFLFQTAPFWVPPNIIIL